MECERCGDTEVLLYNDEGTLICVDCLIEDQNSEDE